MLVYAKGKGHQSEIKTGLARKEDVQYDIQYLYYLVAESSSRGQNKGGLFGRILIGGKKLHLNECTYNIIHLKSYYY